VDTLEEARKVWLRALLQPSYPRVLVGPVDAIGVDLSLPTPDFGETLCLQEADLASQQSLFDHLLLCYVNARADKSDEIASTVQWCPVVEEPAIFSTGASKPVLHLETAMGVKR